MASLFESAVEEIPQCEADEQRLEHLVQGAVHADLERKSSRPSAEGDDRMQAIKEALADGDGTRSRKNIVDSPFFNSSIILLTLLNTVQMGMAADYPEWAEAWLIADNVFTAGFATEMVIKLFTLRRQYFKDVANWLDGLLSVLGILDCWILPITSSGSVDLRSLSVLRVIRLMRLVRILKLLRSFKQLALVIQGVIKAMSTAVYVSLLVLCIIYVFAIFTTEYVGKHDPHVYPGFSTDPEIIDESEMMVNFNPHVCFGSMLSSMITLFNMGMLTEWTDVVRPVALKQPLYLPVFLLFVMFVGFGVMNVLVGVIVDTITTESKMFEQAYAREKLQQKLALLDKIEHILRGIDTDSDGILDEEELSSAMHECSELKQLLKDIDLPTGFTASELLTMLDSNGSGNIGYQEFTTSLFRLLDSDDFQQICIIEMSVNQVKQMVRAQEDTVKKLVEKLQENQTAMHVDLISIKASLGIAADSQKGTGDEKPTVHMSDISIAMREPLVDKSSSVFGSKHLEQQSSIVRQDSVGSTSDACRKSTMGDLTSCRQLEESLRTALMVVSACVEEKLAAVAESLHAQISCCPGEIPPCPSTLPNDDSRLVSGASDDFHMDAGSGNSNDQSRVASENANSKLTVAINRLSGSTKSADSSTLCKTYLGKFAL